VVVLALTLGLLSLGAGIPGVMIAQALAGLVALALAARLYRRIDAGPLRATGPTMREVFAGGTPILFMLFAISVQPYLDVIVLSKLAPARTVGWYGAAKNVMGTLVAPAIIIASASYPRLSRAAKDPAAFRRELRGAIRPLLWLGALGGVGTFLFADVAIALIYGLEGYGPATTVLQVFGLGLFLLFVDVLLGHVITAAGRAKEFAVAKVASVAVATLLNLWLVPWFETHWGNGGVGVVVAFVLSEAVVFAGSIYLLPRGSLEPAVALDVVRAIGSAGLTAALFQVLPPLSPFLAIPLCVAAYGVASLAVGLLSRSDLELARSLVQRRAR
jgi:O-antigen/teichoic acid export membrane protein